MGRDDILLLLITLVMIGAVTTTFVVEAKTLDEPEPLFITNEAFIEGLYSTLDTTDSMNVFSYVFGQLGDEVDVYPGENFYYYKIVANGKTYGGTIGLSTRDRDEGILHFGYIGRKEYPRNDEFKKSDDSGGGQLTADDGVIVEKIDDFTYSVTYEEKTVIFHLSQPLLQPPTTTELADNEVYVGPVFDDSGLTFHLIFNSDRPHLAHILNEDGFVPEELRRYDEHILIGERTGFAFYDDTLNDRRILIGVEASHVLNNDWYDGPFDHMPDNYIATGEVEFQQYVEASYAGTTGRIDKHARYLEREGTRVAIAPYLVYYEREELRDRVLLCESRGYLNNAEMYACLTYQSFRGPETNV